MSGRTRASMVVLGCALVAATAVLMLWPETRTRETGSDGAREERASEEPLVEAEPPDLPVAPAREPSGPAPAMGAVPEEAPFERDVAPEPVVLTGAAVRVDRAGVEHAGDDGRFVLSWRRGAEPRRDEIEVVAGRWQTRVPPDLELSIRELVLAGVPVALSEDEFVVPADRYLLLRGEERHAVALRVVSAATGDELDDVEVWLGPYSFPTDLQHPGGAPRGEPVLTGAASPVRLPPRSDSFRSAMQYFVRAPGYAWGSVAVDHSSAGERTVRLAAEAAVEVELIGSADWLAPTVRLWADGVRGTGYPFAQREPGAGDVAVFEALAPGRYLVSVERGWSDRAVSYGSATIDLVAGERRVVPIAVELPERPVPVRLEGTLTLPLVWERDGVALVATGQDEVRVWLDGPIRVALGDMAPLPDAADGSEVFAWSVELPVTGPYSLSVDPLKVRLLVDVPAGGRSALDVVVPGAADVEVVVVDARSGEEMAIDSLNWSPPRIEGVLSTPLYTAIADPATGRVGFRAPAGAIHLSPVESSIEAVDPRAVFEVAPGANTITYRVHRQYGVRLTFVDGTATIPWDWSWRVGAHKRDGSARDVARGIGLLWFREPGTYELRSEGIPGYASIDGTAIEVRAGEEIHEVVVELVAE